MSVNASLLQTTAAGTSNFDLCRLTKSKTQVDLSPNWIRELHTQDGLPFYRCGRAVFFSKSELIDLIRRKAAIQPLAK
jgi:hypothetical protein